MKFFVAGLVFTLSLGLALAVPSQSATENKEDQAMQECNATNPVQRDPREVIGEDIIAGKFVKISQEEKCFLFCFLQKVNFVNENGEIKNGPGLVNYTIHTIPELGKHVHHIISHVWHLSRWTKGFEDKCYKAFMVYVYFSEGIFENAVADALDSSFDVKEKVTNAIENGQSVDQELSKHIKQFLEHFNKVITSSISKQAEKQTQAQPQEKVVV